MAFIGDIYLEETLADSYDLSTGDSGFTSSNLIQFNNVAIQCSQTGATGSPTFILEQSHDGTNWDEIYNAHVSDGDGSSTIERNQFTGKYIKLSITRNGVAPSGTMTVKLIAK